MSNLDHLSRQDLQKLCKQYGIKANISTKNMKDCLDKTMAGKQISYKFKKLTWFQKNKDYIITGISMLALVSSVTCLYCFIKR